MKKAEYIKVSWPETQEFSDLDDTYDIYFDAEHNCYFVKEEDYIKVKKFNALLQAYSKASTIVIENNCGNMVLLEKLDNNNYVLSTTYDTIETKGRNSDSPNVVIINNTKLGVNDVIQNTNLVIIEIKFVPMYDGYVFTVKENK